MSAACAAFFDAVPAMSSVDSRSTLGLCGAAAGRLTAVAFSAGLAAAGGVAAARARLDESGKSPANGVNGASAGSGVSSADALPSPAASRFGVGVGKARGGGGTAPGGRRVAVAVAPSRSPNVGNAARAERSGFGAGAAVLDEPSTPKLEGASVSRAGSRVIEEAAAAVGDAGGSTTPGRGAVPVPTWLGLACTAGAACFAC
jgi:hypothetical protein